MSVAAQKEQERYNKKFALYQQLCAVWGKEPPIQLATALIETATIPELKRLLRRERERAKKTV